MAAIQLAGLASGFDWKTFTDSVIDLERAPVRRLESEKSKNDTKKAQLTDLGTKLASLRTAMSGLSSTTLSSGRKATFESSSPTWTAEVTDSTPVGNYEVEVVSKATASRLTSGAVSSPTAAGSLTINGTDIAITAGQTVASVISAINNSSAGVTAIFSASAASGAGRIVLTNRDTGATAITVSSKDAAGSADPAIATRLGLTSPTTNVTGLTSGAVSSPTAAGSLTINGTDIAITAGQTVASVISAINNSNAGVTAIYSASAASGAGRIVLTNRDTGATAITVSSKDAAGSADPAIATSLGLASPTTNVTGLTSLAVSSPTARGSLTINGTDIAITAGQTVASVISAINDSNAGVTAIYSASAASGAGRIVLINRDTGATAITVSSKDAAGSADPAIATSLGLTSPTTNVTGSLAVFKVNGLDFTSANNTLDSTDHGITGLSVKVDSVGTENITVASSTADLKTKIEAFVSNYNAVADFIDSKTKITTTAGKTTAGPLADNREIQAWLRELRSTAFRAPGSGEVANLSALGIDFSSTSDQITIKDPAMLDAALSDHASDVVNFFNTSSTGLASAFVAKLDSYAGSTGTGGLLTTKIESYGTANTGLDTQIAALDRYLAQRRSQLESGFMAMENAQSKLKQMQTQLTNAFPNK